MIFESQEKFCITFKSNQSDFNIYSRKLNHDFRVNIYNEDFENAIGLNLDKKEQIVICKKFGQIMIFDSASYEL